ncbi:MAG: septum site-determining protein MinC [Synergistaceae bacterium]|jgi:septum site-determining protein MinC|nr:septum site-determining protein MinC [Synergistaceae bacterium]
MESSGKVSIQLKGTNFGLRVIFPESLDDDVLLEEFKAVPDRAYILPVGTGLVLDFRSRPCSGELAGRILSDVVWPRGLDVLAWLTSDAESRSRLTQAGFKTEEPGRGAFPDVGPLIVNRSLRSGQRREYPGDVVLVGHLNNGAEIFAGGSVCVLGRLKGLVHAGRGGSEGIYVMAASFEPQQLRVGDKLCDQFDPNMKWWKKPVIITLEDDNLFFRNWKTEPESETL